MTDLLSCNVCGSNGGPGGWHRFGHGSISETIEINSEGEIVLVEQEVSPNAWFECSHCGAELDLKAVVEHAKEAK